MSPTTEPSSAGALKPGRNSPDGLKTSRSAPAGAAKPNVNSSVDMEVAVGVSCGAPAPPGRAHSDRVLAELFDVSGSDHSAYLLGWQVEPYRGLGTYHFGTAGNLLALEPPAGGAPLGFGRGTVTFVGKPTAGTVRAVVTLAKGGSVSVKGACVCAISAR